MRLSICVLSLFVYACLSLSVSARVYMLLYICFGELFIRIIYLISTHILKYFTISVCELIHILINIDYMMMPTAIYYIYINILSEHCGLGGLRRGAADHVWM